MYSTTRSTILGTDGSYTSIDSDKKDSRRSFLWVVCGVIAVMLVIGASTVGYYSGNSFVPSSFKVSHRGDAVQFVEKSSASTMKVSKIVALKSQKTKKSYTDSSESADTETVTFSTTDYLSIEDAKKEMADYLKTVDKTSLQFPDENPYVQKVKTAKEVDSGSTSSVVKEYIEEKREEKQQDQAERAEELKAGEEIREEMALEKEQAHEEQDAEKEKEKAEKENEKANKDNDKEDNEDGKNKEDTKKKNKQEEEEDKEDTKKEKKNKTK